MVSSTARRLAQASCATVALTLAVQVSAQSSLSVPTAEECAEIMSEMGLGPAPKDTFDDDVPPATGGAGNDAGGGEGGTGDPGSIDMPGGEIPLPGTNPVPTPTPTPTGGAGGGNLSANTYLRNPDPNNVRISSGVSNAAANNVITYYVGNPTPGYSQQNLSEKKVYTPPRAGIIRSVGGQKVAVKSTDVNVAKLTSPMINIIDEIHITASLLGYPTPIITSAADGKHSAGSLHGSGNAIDLRCNSVNGMSPTDCRKWVVSLAAALGPSYDVIYEHYGNGNNHVHIEFDG